MSFVVSLLSFSSRSVGFRCVGSVSSFSLSPPSLPVPPPRGPLGSHGVCRASGPVSSSLFPLRPSPFRPFPFPPPCPPPSALCPPSPSGSSHSSDLARGAQEPQEEQIVDYVDLCIDDSVSSINGGIINNNGGSRCINRNSNKSIDIVLRDGHRFNNNNNNNNKVDVTHANRTEHRLPPVDESSEEVSMLLESGKTQDDMNLPVIVDVSGRTDTDRRGRELGRDSASSVCHAHNSFSESHLSGDYEASRPNLDPTSLDCTQRLVKGLINWRAL